MFPIDKQAHLWWGMAMVGLMWPVLGDASVAVACAVGLLKEVVDSRDGREFDFVDWAVTCGGGVLATFWLWVVTP